MKYLHLATTRQVEELPFLIAYCYVWEITWHIEPFRDGQGSVSSHSVNILFLLTLGHFYQVLPETQRGISW